MTTSFDTSRMGLDAAAAAAEYLPKAQRSFGDGIETIKSGLDKFAKIKFDPNSKVFAQATNVAFIFLSIYSAACSSTLFFVSMATGIIFKAKLIEVQVKMKEVWDKTFDFFNLPPAAMAFTAIGLFRVVQIFPSPLTIGLCAIYTGASFGMSLSRA